jgi:hypothetical protein
VVRLASVAPPRACVSSYNPLLPQNRTAWLLEIGQKLRIGYDDIAEPMPPHLTALLKLLEIAATQSGSSTRFVDHQTSDGEFAGRSSNESLEVREAGGLRA